VVRPPHYQLKAEMSKLQHRPRHQNPTPGMMRKTKTPSIFDIEQTMVTPGPIYGHVTQAMALDDNILDIQAVSKKTQKCK
jgi:hypothetical protein